MEKLWNTIKASDVLDVSEERMKAWRARGIGPRFIKLGPSLRAHIRYSPSAIREFIEENTVGI